MRCVVQRVSQASVKVEGQIVGSIQRGLLVLLGVEDGDSSRDLTYSTNKISGLRIFADEQGMMNRSVLDIGGQVLVVSQFTLLGDVRKGKRPSFMAAAPPEIADTMYQQFCELLRQAGLVVKTGQFQADMQVSLINDGPVTILIDSRKVL